MSLGGRMQQWLGDLRIHLVGGNPEKSPQRVRRECLQDCYTDSVKPPFEQEPAMATEENKAIVRFLLDNRPVEAMGEPP